MDIDPRTTGDLVMGVLEGLIVGGFVGYIVRAFKGNKRSY